MGDDTPHGFKLADLGVGFGRAFGPVYLDRVGHRMIFRVSERHENPVGVCHGGAMATFADMQIMAWKGGVEEGQSRNPTISLSLDYLAPAPLGSCVEAAVTLVKQTRSMFFTQSIMTVNGYPVARSTAIYRNFEKAGA